MGKEQYLFHQHRVLEIAEGVKANISHQHEYWQVDYITSGSGCLYSGSKKIPFTAGDICIVSPRILHHFEYNSGNNTWLSIKFTSDYEALDAINFKNDLILYKTMEILESVLSPDFLSLHTKDTSVVNAVLGVIASYVITRLKEHEQPVSSFIRKIMQFVYKSQGHYITISDIGDYLGCSGKYASIRFSSETGIPLKQFLDQQRSEYALRVLKTSDSPLSEIAEQLDFRDIYAFSRFFHRTTGETLGNFRKKTINSR